MSGGRARGGEAASTAPSRAASLLLSERACAPVEVRDGAVVALRLVEGLAQHVEHADDPLVRPDGEHVRFHDARSEHRDCARKCVQAGGAKRVSACGCARGSRGTR